MLKLLLVLHDHQPVGNFDHVVAQAVERSYRPFLVEMERHPGLPFGLHMSGPLLEWLESHDATLLERIGRGVDDGRIELIGGGLGEPILPMIPHRDRIGQIRALADWTERRFGVRPRGVWLPERVWEAGLASTLAEAGVEFTFLDDSHFLAAGRAEEELRGAFVVEDGGRTLRVFPICEQLRYDIPFSTVDTVLEHLVSAADDGDQPLLCYADDGEKFGVWPGTYEHVYEEGWLRQFLAALESADDVQLLAPSDALDRLPPRGRVYLPDASYREMNEWTLSIAARERYEVAAAELESTRPRTKARALLRGGVWRNFLVHYPESNLMASRMLRASRRVAALPAAESEAARLELYRGQCNCAYWHGVFGGLYLPHLRSAIYRHLLRADRLADRDPPPLGLEVLDHDRDGRDDVVLETPDVSVIVAPARGGHIVDLSLRVKGVNLLDLLSRRPEFEHQELNRAAETAPGEVQTIHDAVIADGESFREHLVFDEPGLEGLIDRLTDAEGRTLGRFADGPYDLESTTCDGALAAVRMARSEPDVGLSLTKTITLAAGGAGPSVRYGIRGRTGARSVVRFTVELSVGVPGGDTFGRGYRVDGDPVDGNLLEEIRREAATTIEVRDDPMGVALRIVTDRPAALAADPIRTVSRSEAGFELIFQAARIRLSWTIPLETGETWRTQLDLIPDVR